MDDRPLVLVVTLTVRREAFDSFVAYETAAARIMARHGGRIERVVRLAGDENLHSEIHLVTFPDSANFDRYRADAELQALAGLRAQAISGTQVQSGYDAPLY